MNVLEELGIGKFCFLELNVGLKVFLFGSFKYIIWFGGVVKNLD